MENTEPDLENGRKITIEVKKHDSLLKILQDRKQTWRIMTALAIISLIFFLGLGIAVVLLRTFYPYSSIQTTKYGSTIIKNDNKEVIYWLFNTAELWANSGVKVYKGDVITIRSSGSAHTAIHHLADDARNNARQKMTWVNTSGITADNSTRDSLRKQHRIFKNMPTGALTMQVVPEEINLKQIMQEAAGRSGSTKQCKQLDTQLVKTVSNAHRFYYIGQERSDIKISEDGILHFAVNDIILTEKVINEMMRDNLDRILSDKPSPLPTLKQFDTLSKKYRTILYTCLLEPDSCATNKDFCSIQPIYDELKTIFDTLDISEHAYKFAASKSDGKDAISTLRNNEMNYYRDSGYRDAWYDDNIGSFLIIIEKNGK